MLEIHGYLTSFKACLNETQKFVSYDRILCRPTDFVLSDDTICPTTQMPYDPKFVFRVNRP
jgi:hypothetical protein